MNFNTYIHGIDLVIRELTDIKAQLTGANLGNPVFKCVPIRPDSPDPGECEKNPLRIPPGGLEATFLDWIAEVATRLRNLGDLPDTPGESQ